MFPQKTDAVGFCSRFSTTPSQVKHNDTSVKFTMGPIENASKRYKIVVDFKHPIYDPLCGTADSQFHLPQPGSSTFSYEFKKEGCDVQLFDLGVTRDVYLWEEGRDGPLCTNRYSVASACTLTLQTTKLDTNIPVTITGENVPTSNLGQMLQITARGFNRPVHNIAVNNNKFSITTDPLPAADTYRAEFRHRTPISPTNPLGGTEPTHCPTISFSVGKSGQPIDNTISGTPLDLKYCDPPANTQLRTAVGCIPFTGTNNFASWFLKWAIGIAGGIAFLLILFSGFQIMTASGNPEKLQNGRELLTAAISGLILIIFSVFLLKLIGVTILQIPGF